MGEIKRHTGKQTTFHTPIPVVFSKETVMDALKDIQEAPYIPLPTPEKIEMKVFNEVELTWYVLLWQDIKKLFKKIISWAK